MAILKYKSMQILVNKVKFILTSQSQVNKFTL
uniref:Uncharacterized protein n=1 Tax=Porphyridium purpureum TaxID=35688 RepID=W0RZC1_PORPP|nr:hypothetical protein Y721_p068 [Porphyridium purpureum]BAO23740.1 hypothetical protein [Porphyridium purpureum]